VAGLCLEIGMVYPFKLDTIDQVWPENFGGVYKAPGCIAGHDASDASQCRGLILQA